MSATRSARRWSRLIALGQLVLLVLFEGVSLWALQWLGGRVRSLEWTDPVHWIRITEPAEVLITAAHLLATVLAWWLVITTVLSLTAAVARVPSLYRLSRAVTLPVVARMAETAVAASMLGGTVLGGAASAGAAPSTPAVSPLPADMAVQQETPVGAIQRRVTSQAAGAAQTRAPSEGEGQGRAAVPNVKRAAKPATEQRTVTVRKGDSLWRIAGRELGSPERYPELVEHNPWLGSRRYRGGNLIFPGMKLKLPPAAPTRAVPPAPAPPQAAPQTKPSSHANRRPSPPAAAPTTTAPTTTNPTTTNPTTTNPTTTNPTTTRPEQPSRGASQRRIEQQGRAATQQREGDQRRLSDNAAAEIPKRVTLLSSREPVSETRPVLSAPLEGEPKKGPLAAVMNDSSLLALGGSVMAASVAGLLTRMRRQQQRHRTRGIHMAPPPDPQLAAIELALLDKAEPEVLHRVSSTAELVHRAMAGLDLPAVVSLRVGPDQLELVVDGPDSLPAPWERGEGPHRWVLPHGGLDLATGGPDPSYGHKEPAAPAVLVPVGSDPSGATVLINLATARIVGIDGPHDRCARMIRAGAVTLATAPWSDVDIALLPSEGATPREEESSTPLLGRLHAHHDLSTALAALRPGRRTVIAAPAPLSQAELATLQQATADGQVLAMVSGKGLDPLQSWLLDAGPDRLQVGHFAQVRPEELDAVSLKGLSCMAAHAAAPLTQTLPLAAPPLSPSTAAPAEPAGAEMAGDETILGPRPPVFVRVLGPVDLEGAGQFSRAKSRELAVYLALHSTGISEGQLDEALWPATAGQVKATTRDSTVSVARKALGGIDRFPTATSPSGTKRYTITNQVGCDWDRFRRLVDPASADRARLRAAMGLVRGRPFEDTGGRGWGWADTELHTWHMTEQVADAADQLAEWDLAAGDARTARRVARQGLVVDPWCERLYVRLMEAAHAMGDAKEVERVIDELDRVLELGGDLSSLHPDTMAAYDHCRRQPALEDLDSPSASDQPASDGLNGWDGVGCG